MTKEGEHTFNEWMKIASEPAKDEHMPHTLPPQVTEDERETAREKLKRFNALSIAARKQHSIY